MNGACGAPVSSGIPRRDGVEVWTVEWTFIQLSAILAVVFSTSAKVSLSQFRQRYVYGFLCTMIILGLHMNT